MENVPADGRGHERRLPEHKRVKQHQTANTSLHKFAHVNFGRGGTDPPDKGQRPDGKQRHARPWQGEGDAEGHQRQDEM